MHRIRSLLHPFECDQGLWRSSRMIFAYVNSRIVSYNTLPRIDAILDAYEIW